MNMANAKINIGSSLCGTLPGTISEGYTDYPITCDLVGDFVEILGSGTANLGFSEVKVYSKIDNQISPLIPVTICNILPLLSFGAVTYHSNAPGSKDVILPTTLFSGIVGTCELTNC